MDQDFIKTDDGKTIIQAGGSYLIKQEGADPELQHRTSDATEEAAEPSKPVKTKVSSRKEVE